MINEAPPDISQMDTLWVWHLQDPEAPVLVGAVSLIPGSNRCSFVYDERWKERGFPLSPDMPIGPGGVRQVIAPAPGWSAPGALDDAMPDRWGQAAIRVIDRPKRLSTLDFLYYAGDRRIGALGVSRSRERYTPHPNAPLLKASSLEEAHQIIQRIQERQPLNAMERRMIDSSRSAGGAQPKMLISIAGEEWIAKFPNGNNVDYPLVEHASMCLARSAGIEVVESKVHRIGIDHVVLSRRFDREPRSARRRHTLSAKTMVLDEATESYAAIAAAIRSYGAPAIAVHQQRELFRRMAFNIMIDNTDDHAKNHAFIRSNDGFYRLSPAFDIPPQMNGLGFQAIPIVGGESAQDRDAAIAAADRFGMSRGEAASEWQIVADAVTRWKEAFRGAGVLDLDINYLSDFLESEAKLALRDGPDAERAEEDRAVPGL